MALKKTNFEVKELGITLPEAIAIAQVDTKMGVATFNIGVNRDMALAGKTVKQVKMYMTFDRNQNPYVQAYKKATTPEMVKQYNPETSLEEEIEVKPFFYGWEDVIVE
jgi:hypothetical protein